MKDAIFAFIMGCCGGRNMDNVQRTIQSLSSEQDEEDMKGFAMKNNTLLPELLFYFNMFVEGKGEGLNEISIVDQRLTEKNVEMLAVLLRELKNIRTLQLVNNSLNKKTVGMISDQFQFLAGLFSLNLSFNSFTAGGLARLFERIHLLKKLKLLSLVSCGLKDQDKEEIFKVLKKDVCSELLSVDVRDNDFSFEVLVELVKFCRDCGKVKVFFLENNNVGKGGMILLKEKAKELTIDEEY
jgi:Ran GTPase-activating protein (RanGAP) involved in mRNA processing and transport